MPEINVEDIVRKNVKDAEANLKKLKVALQKARDGGINVTELDRLYKKREESTRKLKAAYGA